MRTLAYTILALLERKSSTAGLVMAGLILGAYLAGSVPFGLIVGLVKGKDPRLSGSHNIGATNVGRILGGRYFVLVFLLDMFKGLLPMLGAWWAMAHRNGAAPGSMDYLLWMLVGLAAIAGHMFSLFLGFKGGKGVATSAGVILGLFPYFTYPALVVVAAFAISFFFSRIVSLSSMVAAAVFPAAYLAIGLLLGWPLMRQWPLGFFSLLVAVMILYKHRENIARLRAGTEKGMRGKM